MKQLLAALGLLYALSAAGSGFWERNVWDEPGRGFLFYGPEKPEEKDRDLALIKDIGTLKAEVKKRLERSLMDPGPENLKSYQEANAFLLEKSAQFAKAWELSLIKNPKLDFTVQNPSANYAQAAMKSLRQELLAKRLEKVRENWGLVVIVQDGCFACETASPVIREAVKALGAPALTVSLSGRPAAYPEARPDNGAARKLAELSKTPLAATPALYLLRKDGEKALHVASGARSMDEILTRVAVLMEKEDHEKHPY